MIKNQKTFQGQDCPIPNKIIPSPSPAYTPKRPNGDGLFTLILIALGTLGLYHVGATYEQPSVYNTNISPSSHYNTYEASIGAPLKTSTKQASKTKKTFSNQLIISGKPQIANKLAFTIDSFDKDVSYLIDLGNGDFIEPRQKTARYEYPISGSYLVELIATYKGQETILYSDFVDVYNSVELVSSIN